MMLTTFLKKNLEKVMKGELKIIFTSNMTDREVENKDFRGLAGPEPAAAFPEEFEKDRKTKKGRFSALAALGQRDELLEKAASSEDWARMILEELTFQEKASFITGYSSLAIHPVPRLGLPSLWSSDATSGLRCFSGGTAFPAPLAMAATWNPELIEKLGQDLGEEARARGISILLGPGINIYRVPTNGRNFEYMGEDPFLSGKIAAGYIRGVQSRGVITTVKHFACNNSEYDRHKCDSEVDERTLREIYLPAFRRAVKEGGTMGVMSAYNPVNGVYASENHKLLTEILRDTWDFKGFVMSDWNSLYSTAGPIKNGLDIEMPGKKWLTEEKIRQELNEGSIVEEEIDRMVFRLLSTLHAAGAYNRPQVDKQASPGGIAHIETALETAREAVILLKNKPPADAPPQTQPLLPLDTTNIKELVVMGRTTLMTPTGGGGSSLVPVNKKNDILRGIMAELEEQNKGIRIHYIPYRKTRIGRKNRDRIRRADAVILCAGFQSYEETECFDRSWTLPEKQGNLIKAAAALNPRTAVILTAGGGVETESWIHDVPALIHSLYLGQTTGKALADVLFGKVNPSGKLPFTMARRWSDFASTSYYVNKPDDFSPTRIFIGQGDPGKRKIWPMPYSEQLMVGYRNFDTMKIIPQFPFGHGLSYTDFELSGLKVAKPLIKERENRIVSFTLTNTGKISGAQVAQVYVKDVESELLRPEKELKGFKKVFLQSGESAKITLPLTPEDFSYFHDGQNKWVCEPGEFIIKAGFSSRDIREEVTIKIN